MSVSIDHQLKVGFRTLFPDYAKALDRAKSQKEINILHSKFIQEAKANLAKVLGKDVSSLDDSDKTAPIALTQKQYQSLIHATGDEIKNELLVLIDGVSRLKGIPDDDPGAATAQLIVSGALAVGGIAWKAASSDLVAGAIESAAAFAGVSTATVAVVVAIVALIIIAIIIPIIYFAEKPANCIVLLINELDDELTFAGDYNAHGKPQLNTSPIPAAVIIPEVGTYPVAGFIATEKLESALVGTQYGFSMQYKDTLLSFGVECPLTALYEDNNCYCAIGENAEQAANTTQSANVQYFETAKNGISLSIRCNSGAGSIAYYVARAYKTPS